MSIAWIIAAFVMGGSAGILLMALMQAAARREQAMSLIEALSRSGLAPLDVATRGLTPDAS